MKITPAYALAALAMIVGPAFAVDIDGALSTDLSPELPNALAAGWQGENVCELLQEGAGARMLRCTFPPGVGHERHYHPPHIGYILDGGTMKITDASGTRDVTSATGGSWQSDGVIWHEVVNQGDVTTRYLIVEKKR